MWRGFSPRAASLHSKATRAHTDFPKKRLFAQKTCFAPIFRFEPALDQAQTHGSIRYWNQSLHYANIEETVILWISIGGMELVPSQCVFRILGIQPAESEVFSTKFFLHRVKLPYFWKNCFQFAQWRKCISVTGNLCGKVYMRPIDKLDVAYTNADDQMMLVQHCNGDRVMS